MYIHNVIKIKLIRNVIHFKFLVSSSKSSLSPDPGSKTETVLLFSCFVSNIHSLI